MGKTTINVRPLSAQRAALASQSNTLLYVGGLGSGKSWTGALWCMMAPPGSKILCVAPSYRILRDGTRATFARICPSAVIHKTDMTVTLPNGTVVFLRSADNLDASVRSVEVDRVWFEEGAYIQRAAIQVALGRMRASAKPRTLVTTTPRKNAAIYDLWVRDLPEGVEIVTSRTEDNPAISREFIAQLRRDYGERLAAQELDGQWVDVTGGLWTHDLIHIAAPDKTLKLTYAIGVDPNAGGGAEIGIVVVARDPTGHIWIIEDASGQYGVTEWPEVVASLARRWHRATVVAEVNQGGDMVERSIRSVDPSTKFVAVRAVKSKSARAQPVATLYRQGKVTHCDVFPRLVAQMTGWDPELSDTSPDRMDALVWGVTHFAEIKAAGSWADVQIPSRGNSAGGMTMDADLDTDSSRSQIADLTHGTRRAW